MPQTGRRPRRLTDAELEQLLELTEDADSVEASAWTTWRSSARSPSSSLGAAATAEWA